MKKTMLIFAGLLIAATSFAGGSKYQETMGKTLAGFAECKTIADFQELGNKFMVISKAETKEWLPLYYHAQCYILMGFNDNENPQMKDEYLDVAAESVRKMIEIAPGESEVFVMQGLLYTARLMIDPMTRGQQYSALSGQAIGRALGMEPKNPRAKYMQIANELGTAKFFGSDNTATCQKAYKLYEEWDNYKPKSPIHPQWGKEQLSEAIESCNRTE